MGQVTTYNCDRCPAVKQKTNNWWIVAQKQASGRPQSGAPAFMVRQLDRKLRDGELVLCGQVCVQKALNEYLANPAGELKSKEVKA